VHMRRSDCTASLMQYVKLMHEACHLLMVLTVFGCNNMLHWTLLSKNRQWMMSPLFGQLILWHHYRAANKYLTWQDICPITFNFGRTKFEFGRTKTNVTKFGRTTYTSCTIYIYKSQDKYEVCIVSPAQR
jgi:hypothetical protein